MENKRKAIKGREEICKAYGFGKVTFYWLLEQQKTKDLKPFKKINGHYWAHCDTLDEFLRQMIVEPSKEANK